MAKVKYYYDPKTLSYRKIEKDTRYRLQRTGAFLVASALLAGIFLFVADTFIDSPKEKRLKRELENMRIQYDILDQRLDHVAEVLEDLEQRDDNIYRVIFEAEPIPNSIRKAGFGGANRYKKLEGYQNSELIKEASMKLDRITKQVYVQSKSFDELVELAENKGKLLEAIPAIQPVANEDLNRLASGYGFRLDPFTKAPKMHFGMDFSADIGTPVYATGDGVVERADNKSSGFGNHIRLDHGFGYLTLYAHLSEYNVRVGQKVKRGEVIGYVGNTGRSRGPHLHYEVWLNEERLNPVNFYYGELSPEEFSTIIQMANQANQSFD
ncbi:MAG TPA: peptidase M23 [Cryomorphaceae bacterium]|nr:peptidase M23 [Owenweeksia sp.]MBG00116.1 peptidase M23 [Owenweeksia sp.]HAD98389.1 peptidase M23 [Cryomorphaceae bacterium]HBF18841.1 peptidase M23 [Cryomorphaceae bacterium]HCQ17039.1 peptidase M23 [Cryomorphaceae bacterium]|tara:strand:+ start:16168 stop:17139 length:972 start_codon:yes stop_codon:yes gene_type:complete